MQNNDDTSFTLITHRITKQKRHNSLYYIVSDLMTHSMHPDLCAHPTLQTTYEHLSHFVCVSIFFIKKIIIKFST